MNSLKPFIIECIKGQPRVVRRMSTDTFAPVENVPHLDGCEPIGFCMAHCPVADVLTEHHTVKL